MATNRKVSELVSLETYRLVLTNVSKSPVIARQMAEYGYTDDVMEEGRKLYETTLKAYSDSKNEWKEKKLTHMEFKRRLQTLRELFLVHREKAKYVFRSDEVLISQLALKKRLPKRYTVLLDRIRFFYSTILAEEKFKTEIARLNVSEEELNEGQRLIKEVQTLRARFMKEKAESQNATDKKKEAFRELDHWMQGFFGLAKIALREHPQLQEAFGKTVRN